MDFNGLLEPQKKHSKFLLDSIYTNGVALDLSPMGTGKMYCGSWIASQLNCPTVVICPHNIITEWHNVLEKFGIKNAIVINYESLVRGNSPYLKYDLKKFHATPKWWESRGIELTFRKDSFVIIDEVHRCRGQASLCSDLLVAIKNNGYKTLGCTGTAATAIVDMKALGYFLNLHDGKNFRQWCRDYGAVLNGYGTIDWSADQSPAHDGMLKINDLVFNKYKIAARLKREEFEGIFPENRLIVDVFDLGKNTTKLQQVYANMYRELDELNRRAANYSQHVFAIMMKAKRQSELLKVPTMVDWIIESFEDGTSPVVFVNFKDTIEGIRSRLPNAYKSHFQALEGGISKIVRNKIVADFQSDTKRILAANMKAGSASLGFHDLNGKYPRRSLINPSFSAVDVCQATGRIFRAKGLTPCLQRFFYAADSIEEEMADRMEKRVNNLDLLNDADLSYDFNH
jgi:hypothetical protein